MKKAFYVSSLLVFCVLTGCALPTDHPSSSAESNVPTKEVMQNGYAIKANELYTIIFRDYWDNANTYAKYYYPSNPDEKEFAYMWPYMQMHSMANSLLELAPDNVTYRENLISVIEGLEKYRSTFSDMVCYQSYPLEFGGGDPFYDDNIWIALELYESYKLLNNEEYLETAKAIFDYVVSGWNEENGGLYWKESSCDIMTTCTNAPTIIMAARLYEETGESAYLEWAEKIYVWLKSTLLADDGLFWDHINTEGKIEKTKWSYNTGMMISAAAELYSSTDNETYLNDAAYYAASADARFRRIDSVSGDLVYPKTPWFNMLLYKGFIDLMNIDGNTEYANYFTEYLDSLWDNNRCEFGYIHLESSLNGTYSAEYHSLLDQASFAQCYALAACID